jgi:hypothetical protein
MTALPQPQPQPQQPRSFPSAFNGFGDRMLHDRIAVWSHLRNDFQVYDVNRENYPAFKLTPTNTSRTDPFYFAEGPGDTQSRTFTLYRPRARIHSHMDMAIWHTGGWLCKRGRHHLEAVIPILAVADPAKLVWVGNVGLGTNTEGFREWLQFQTPSFYRPIIHNRILARPVTEWEEDDTTSKPEPIPQFVAEALLAKSTGELCPITMEPLAAGNVSVTSCFHIFQKDAIEQWLAKNTTCPVCKKECSVTHC